MPKDSRPTPAPPPSPAPPARPGPVTHRKVKNNRLAAAGYTWAFSALTASPGARAHYDRRREHGDSHAAALRNLSNRYIGILFHCLQHGLTYDETKAFPTLTKIEHCDPRSPWRSRAA